jgi:hypothetical protein
MLFVFAEKNCSSKLSGMCLCNTSIEAAIKVSKAADKVRGRFRGVKAAVEVLRLLSSEKVQ